MGPRGVRCCWCAVVKLFEAESRVSRTRSAASIR
jgi:hypothetical protein